MDTADKENAGIYVCASHQSEYLVSDNVFRCKDGSYISYIFICDGKKDCPGDVSSDEIGCECNATLNYTSQCKFIKTSSEIEECSDFYFKTWDKKCVLFDFSLLNIEKSMASLKLMSNPEELDVHHPTISNEWKENKMGKLSCHSAELLKYTSYQISEICSYTLNEQGHLLPCNKGEHLQNCQQFECNMKIKCPKFYCIPWGYICDGKWDCPGGYDESIYHLCGNRACINMFKCKMSSTCLHLGDVCNGHFNCPHQDDEYLCLLKDITCPSVCHCVAFAIRCYSVEILEYTLSIYFPYITATLMYCSVFREDKLSKVFQYVSFLFITNSNLKKICAVISLMKHVRILDASKNAISTLKANCFKNKVALRVIKLNNNRLQHIQKFAFYNSPNILFIDLSNNKLVALSKYSTLGIDKLSFLSLENATLDLKETKDTLNILNIKFLRIEYFSICCFGRENFQCSAKQPWYMSCSHFLVNTVIKYTFYLVSFLILVANIFHLFLQKKQYGKSQNIQTTRAFDDIITSISILDITSSIPLFILWLSDLYFKEKIVILQNQWQSSAMCFISGGINMYYSLASPFLYNLLSYTRYDVVKNPLDSNFKRSYYVHKIILFGCILSLFFAVLIVTLFWLNNDGMPNRFCSPLFDPSGRFPSTEYLAWFIVSVHVAAVSVNLITHLKLAIKIIMVQNVCHGTESRTQSKRSLFVQIACISCSHLLCWIPGIIILLIANL